MSIRLSNTQREEVATLLSGEILGEISFVDSRPPSASVIAMEDSSVLAIPQATITEKLQEDPAFSARFYRAVASFLADRLRTTVGRFGYGKNYPDPAADELDEYSMEKISVAAVRFDSVLKRLCVN